MKNPVAIPTTEIVVLKYHLPLKGKNSKLQVWSKKWEPHYIPENKEAIQDYV